MDGESYLDKETSLTCPVGAFAQHIKVGKSGYYPFSSLRCVPCDMGTYNLNGSTFSNCSINHDVCWKCPPGATCQDGRLKPLDNYWGFLDRKTGNLSLVELPIGYGCSKGECKRYDSCATKRQGTLCSRCINGYTESMLSSECFKNEECNRAMFWAVAIMLVAFYVFFFIYKKSILSFLKTRLLSCKKLDSKKEENTDCLLNEDRYISFEDEPANATEEGHCEDDTNHTTTQSESLAGLLKIIFYFLNRGPFGHLWRGHRTWYG